MTELGKVWRFTRVRLEQAISGVTDLGATWRPHENSHTIAEILYHIAGAEHYWAARLTGRDPEATEFEAKLDRAIHDGFLREGVSPFATEEMAIAACNRALEFTGREIEPLFTSPTREQLEMPLTSPVGDEVKGADGLSRLAQHAGYHTGQIWMIRMNPRFPA